MDFLDFVALFYSFFAILGMISQSAQAGAAMKRDDTKGWCENFISMSASLVLASWLLSTVF